MKRTAIRVTFLAVLTIAASAGAVDYKVVATGLAGPENLAFDGKGALYVSDVNRLWVIDQNHDKKEIYLRDPATDGISLGGVSLGPDGKIYFSVGNQIKTHDPRSGAFETFVTGFNFANGNCFDDAGNFFIAESGERKLYVVPVGTKEPRVLKDKLGTAKGLGVNGLVWSRANSTLYYTVNLPSKVGGLKLGPDLAIIEESTIAKFPLGGLDDLTIDDDGNLFVCMWINGKIMKVSPEGKKELLIEDLDGPSAIAFGLGPDAGKLHVLIKGGSMKFEGTDMIVIDTEAKGYRLPFLP